MAKNSIRDYSATNSLNTDIQSIDISEGCSPAGINNAIREVMADLKDVSTGAVALESPSADSLTVTGDLTVDTNTLYVDSTNNRVGVGTTSPQNLVQIEGSSGTVPSQLRLGVTSGSQYYDIGRDYTDGLMTFYSGQASPYTGYKWSVNAGTEAMRIDNSGNVGIGTSSPINNSTTNLQIHGGVASGSSELRLTNADTGATASDGFQLQMYQGTDAYLNNRENGPMIFKTNNSEAMRIDSSGNVRVNTTSSLGSAKFFVESDTTSSNPISVINTRASAATDYHMLFYRAGSLVGSIQTSLSATSYVTSSDYRLKTSVNYDWDATSRLKQLKPARFEWIADGDDAVPVDGFLAHEVSDIVPEAVTGTKDAVDGEGNPVYQGIDQSKLTPLLTKALIEAVEKIEQLEARIAALEAN